MMSRFYNPVAILFGAESVGELADSAADALRDATRVLLLTRGGAVEKSEELQPLMETLSGKDVRLAELNVSNPDLADIVELKSRTRGFDYELIVAVGGGSVMDVAKTLSALQHLDFDAVAQARDAITEERYRERRRMTPWIGIPTTAGTGSEVTCWATIWDAELGRKYSVSDERLYAKAAVIVPELTATMPLRLSATTALDAMCHAAEAYWSVRTNPVTRMYAVQAIERIRLHLPRLAADPGKTETRTQLALASLYAGLAFSNTMTTACHSISYPLTLRHGIEHGVAASFTLGAVLRLNLPAMVEPDRLLAAFGAREPEEVQRLVFGLFRSFGIPTRLGDYGVQPDDVPGIVSRAYTKGRMDNNPVAIAEQQLQDMLRALI